MRTFILDRVKYNVLANPPIEFAESLIEKVRGYDEIISVGGGSTIDCGKYVAWKLNIPHTAIPTTAGTGSEATKFAVFEKDGKRISLENEDFIPDKYVLDPSRIVSLPRDQTAYTGLDALSQGIESYWSPLATGESRHWAKLAIRYASKYLYDSWLHPESETLRQKMLWAANYSGRAINITRTSVCHAISYPLTLHYKIPHGQACAHTLPFFMRYFDFPLLKAERVEKMINDMDVRINLTFDKELVAKEAMESLRTNNTPKPITKEIILQALNENIFSSNL